MLSFLSSWWSERKGVREKRRDPFPQWRHIHPLGSAAEPLEPAPLADGAGLCAWGCKLYAVGGCVIGTCYGTTATQTAGNACPPSLRPTARVVELDPATNASRDLTPLSFCASGVGVCVTGGGTLYAIGGHDIERDYICCFRKLDLTKRRGKWRDLAPLDIPGMYAPQAVCAIGERIFVVEGRGIAEYDPKADVWCERSPMGVMRMNPAVCALGGKIYALGGYNADENLRVGASVWPHGRLTSMEEYDPEADVWSERAPMACPRQGAGACAVGATTLVVVGGGSGPGGRRYVEAFHAGTNTWSELALTAVVRPSPAVCATDGVVYVVGSSRGYAYGYYSDVSVEAGRVAWPVWSPVRHSQFPSAFRGAVLAVLLGRKRLERSKEQAAGDAGSLPQLPWVAWLLVLSFCSHDWF